jgi:hypothetical protein
MKKYGGVVSVKPWPLYPRYPLDRRLGGPQSRSGRRGEEKILDPTGTRNSDPSVVSRYTDCALPAPTYDDDSIQYVFIYVQT